MTILNDKEIRKLCEIPTHVAGNESYSIFYSKVSEGYYSFDSGKIYSFKNLDDINLREMQAENFEQFDSLYPKRMITPFNEKLSEVGRISHGLSSFGYDATCSNKYKIAVAKNELFPNRILDPKDVDPTAYYDFEGDVCIIPPHGFALTNTNEIFDIPEDILSICMAKSTYARIGLVVGVTPLEPGWRGSVTIELSNTTDLPIKVYSNEGVCQFLFFRGRSKADIPYNKRGGKYMDQEGIVLSRVLS